MDSELETIVSNEVYLLFVEEFEHLHLSSWTDFLQKKKDLGIEYIILIDSLDDHYKITDERKWMFAKLKYGF